MRYVNISAIGAEAVCKVRRITCTLTTTAGQLSRGAPNRRHGKNKTTPLCEGNRINSRLSGLAVPSGADSRSAQRAAYAERLTYNANYHALHSPAACVTTPGYPAAGAPNARSALFPLFPSVLMKTAVRTE